MMSLQSFLLREAILYKSKSESDDFTPQDEKTLKVSTFVYLLDNILFI